MRQCKFGAPRRLATVPRPDISDRVAQLETRVNSLQGSDIYRISEVIQTVKEWQEPVILTYPSSSTASELVQRSGPADREARKSRGRAEKVHFGAMTLVDRSDAANGYPTKEGRF